MGPLCREVVLCSLILDAHLSRSDPESHRLGLGGVDIAPMGE